MDVLAYSGIQVPQPCSNQLCHWSISNIKYPVTNVQYGDFQTDLQETELRFFWTNVFRPKEILALKSIKFRIFYEYISSDI